MGEATFTKLKKQPGQPWGVRVKPPDANPGEQVTVTTQKGESKTVVLGAKVATFEDAALFTIAEDPFSGTAPQTPSAPAQSQASTYEEVTPSKTVSEPKGDAFWAQKDRRISRAGLLQAVVASGYFNELANPAEYVPAVNKLTDALMASLDERTPSPNQ